MRGVIIKTILIILLILSIKQIYAQEITPEIITTQPKEIEPDILNAVERFYEISEKSLKIGYNITLDTRSAFRTSISGHDRYIIADNFSDNLIMLTFLSGERKLINQPIKAGDYIIFKIEDLNLQFILNAANKTNAEVQLKLFEEKIPENISYFQLFDIKVHLVESKIYQSSDLAAVVEFTNFGEGPSQIRIVYSIIDKQGKELLTSIDEKIIETNEVVIKRFDTLNVPYGEYKIQTTIYYGNNQEAKSEDSFTIEPMPKYEILKEPILFIVTIVATLAIVIFFKRKDEKKETSIS